MFAGGFASVYIKNLLDNCLATVLKSYMQMENIQKSVTPA